MNHANFPPLSPALPGMARRAWLSLMIFACVFTAACVFRAPIQQGNLLENKDIDQIKVGMTQAQVRYVLGTPMVVDPFSKDRWDYVYYFKVNKMPIAKESKFVVYFTDGNVAKFERTDNSNAVKEAVKQQKDQWYRRWLNWFV